MLTLDTGLSSRAIKQSDIKKVPLSQTQYLTNVVRAWIFGGQENGFFWGVEENEVHKEIQFTGWRCGNYKKSFLMGTSIELFQKDCIEGMQTLQPESVDVIVTSPPYNLGIAYGHYVDKRNAEDYLDWCAAWAAEIVRVLQPEGSFFLNAGSTPAQPLLPHALVLRLSQLFTLQNTFHWIKSISVRTPPVGETISAGHFKPINSRRYVTDCHEFVFHFTHTGKVPLDKLALGVPYVHKSNVARWKHTAGRDQRCRGNTWFIPYQTIQSRDKDRPHPATFPVELAEHCIRIHGNVSGQTVLDPFVGIGHAAQAAKHCGVSRFIGFDIDADYLATARALLS